MVEWRMVDPSFCEQGDKWSIEEESREGEVVVEENKGLDEIPCWSNSNQHVISAVGNSYFYPANLCTIIIVSGTTEAPIPLATDVCVALRYAAYSTSISNTLGQQRHEWFFDNTNTPSANMTFDMLGTLAWLAQ